MKGCVARRLRGKSSSSSARISLGANLVERLVDVNYDTEGI